MNLNGIIAADDDDDNIDNSESPPKYENSIGDLDGNKDEYYQLKGNNKDDEANIGYDGVPDDNDIYGVIYDRTDDANTPLLPSESNMPCIHSTNITNNGDILSLQLFSLVYRAEQSNEVSTLIDEVYQVEQFDEVNTLID